MKAEDLVRLIDKLVEKKLNTKVQGLIREAVAEEVSKAMGKVLVEMVKEIKKPTITEEIHREEDEPPRPAPTPINTNNPKLNAVLAETAKNFRPLRKESGGQLAELMDGGFDKVGQGEDTSYSEPNQPPQPKVVVSDGTNLGFLKQVVSEGTTTGQQQSVLGTDAVPDVLKNVFFKKAASVVRKMNEQKRSGAQGLIDPRSVLSG